MTAKKKLTGLRRLECSRVEGACVFRFVVKRETAEPAEAHFTQARRYVRSSLLIRCTGAFRAMRRTKVCLSAEV